MLIKRAVVFVRPYEKRNSLSTGEPENSGFNMIQLRVRLSVTKPIHISPMPAQSCGSLLEKVLQASPPLLEEPRPELGDQALGWQLGHSRLEIRKCSHEPTPQVVKLGVSFPYVHITALSPPDKSAGIPSFVSRRGKVWGKR